MAISPIYIGIDISKDFLDVFDPRDGCSRRHANAPEAIQILKAHWRGAGVFVCFESSGVCTEDLVACLEEDGIDYACFNPERVRSFARALGHLAKTDAIDAKVISLYAAAASPEPQSAPDEAQKMLKTLTLRRDQLVNMRAREKNHRAATKNMAIHNMIDTHTGQLDADIARIQKAIDECIQSDPDLAARAALMRSIPGVGAVTTALMLASMPEAGKLDSKEIAALAGLAPMNRDSGRTSGKRRIQSGRWRIRKAFYIAAVATLRKQGRFKAYYETLKKRGKPSKVAIIALARKILTTLNAILKSGKPYAET